MCNFYPSMKFSLFQRFNPLHTRCQQGGDGVSDWVQFAFTSTFLKY